VEARLEAILPPRTAGLAGPAATGLREVAEKGTARLLADRRLEEAGLNPIAQDAGHADMALTFRTYTHVMRLQEGDRDRLRDGQDRPARARGR
jgi:integrase